MSNNAYTDPIYGVTMTHIFSKEHAGGKASAQATANIFRMPYRAKLIKFGIINTATTIDASTSQSFCLRYTGRKAGTSTELATYVAPANATFASYTSYGVAPETATWIPENRLVEPHIKGLGEATQSRIGFYMEYQRAYDG